MMIRVDEKTMTSAYKYKPSGVDITPEMRAKWTECLEDLRDKQHDCNCCVMPQRYACQDLFWRQIIKMIEGRQSCGQS